MTAARLESVLRAASPDALVAYVTAGFPDGDAFLEVLERVEQAADVVEIGVPFSDPLADGVTLQRTGFTSLERGFTLRGLLARLQPSQTPRVVMSYLNPLLALGPDLVPSLVSAGVSGLVVPDLPVEESGALDAALADAGLALVQLIAPTTPLTRACELAARSRGFTYVVTARGVTGGDVALDPELPARLAAIREASAVPVLAGFGIRRAEQVQAFRPHGDGVIVGSALMSAVADGQDPFTFLRALRPGLRRAS